MAELRRLLCSPRQLITLLMLTVINLALFSGYCRTAKEEQAANAIYQAEFLLQRPADYEKQAEEAEQTYLTTGYYEYLSYVEEQSERQSILGKLSKNSSFVTRNLEKTAKDYKKLHDVKLTKGENRGIRAVMDYRVTDLLLLIAPLLLVLELSGDADTAIGALTRTTKRGRVPLCCMRILAITLLNAANVMLLYGGNILYAGKFFGNPGLQRAIQSVPDFQSCAARITVGGYFAGCCLMKSAALTAIALTVWILFSRFYSFLGWGIAIPLLGIQYLFSTAIVPTSAANHLKFVNLASALESDIYFTQYCNLNWFGHPSGILTDIIMALILALTVLILLTVLLIGKLRPGRVGQQLETVKDRILRKLNRHLPVHSLFGFEGWKLLIAERALLTIAVCAVFGFSLWKDTRFYAQPVDTQKFYTKYSGEITQENIQKAEKLKIGEEDKLERDGQSFRLCMANEASEDMKDMLRTHIYFDWVYLERYETFLETMVTTKEFAQEHGFTAYLIDDDPYMKLFEESAAERRCCMLLLLFLIFSFYGIGAYDNRYDTRLLLRSTKKGRGAKLGAQILWCCILTAAAVLVCHGIFLLRLHTDLGFTHLNADMRNLAVFRDIPFRMSLRGCIIWLMIQRYLSALLLCGLIMLVSRLSKTPQRALLLVLVILVLPTALAESGILHMPDFLRVLSCCKSELI